MDVYTVKMKDGSLIKNKLPSREVLYEELIKHPFTKLAHKYGVSDNAIRRWCIKLDIPSKSSYYSKKAKELGVQRV